MNKIQIRKIITAIIFMICLFIFSVCNIIKSAENITKVETELSSIGSVNKYESSIESAMEDSFMGKYYFIEGFGALQRVIGKHEYNNFKYVVDKDGFIYYSSIKNYDNKKELYKLATCVKNFSEKYKNTKIIVATPPDRFYDNQINGYTGIPYLNTSKDIDTYYAYLSQMGIATLDYRDSIKKSGYVKEDLYYKTDHHWKTKASFLAFNQFVELLNSKYGENLDKDNYYRNIDNYESIKYKDRFAGSFGRELGYFYTGLDDFELLLPKFSTSYTFKKETQDGNITSVTGSFDDTVVNKTILTIKSKPYFQDVYSCYCDGVLYPLGQIINLKNKNKPKILLIRDSYSSSFAAFLSTVCSEVDLLYPKYEYNIDKLIKEKNYDYVVFSGYSGTLTAIYEPFVNKYINCK